jgi:predicted Zn-dependent protease
MKSGVENESITGLRLGRPWRKLRPMMLFARAGLACCALLAGCGTLPSLDRNSLAPLAPVSAVYSEMNMKLTLVTMRDRAAEQGSATARLPDSFEQRVARVGAKLAETAFELYPELRGEIKSFEFVIANKAEPGTVSTSFGRVVILRPVSDLAPADAALAFILAREMGHVIANHHTTDVAVTLAVSGIVYILAPFATVLKSVANLLVPSGATAATSSVALNASTTAASWAGSKVAVLSYKPEQQEKADGIAMRLLERLTYGKSDVTAAFAPVDLKAQKNSWVAALDVSVKRLAVPFDQAASQGSFFPLVVEEQ